MGNIIRKYNKYNEYKKDFNGGLLQYDVSRIVFVSRGLTSAVALTLRNHNTIQSRSHQITYSPVNAVTNQLIAHGN